MHPAPALLPRPVAAVLRGHRGRPDDRGGRRAVPACSTRATTSATRGSPGADGARRTCYERQPRTRGRGGAGRSRRTSALRRRSTTRATRARQRAARSASREIGAERMRARGRRAGRVRAGTGRRSRPSRNALLDQDGERPSASRSRSRCTARGYALEVRGLAEVRRRVDRDGTGAGRRRADGRDARAAAEPRAADDTIGDVDYRSRAFTPAGPTAPRAIVRCSPPSATQTRRSPTSLVVVGVAARLPGCSRSSSR